MKNVACNFLVQKLLLLITILFNQMAELAKNVVKEVLQFLEYNQNYQCPY